MRDEDLIAVADRYGTPLYVYDLDELRSRSGMFRDALGPDIGLLYAVKANPNPEILKHALSWADGLDVSSGGELRLCLANGWDASALSFAGPGKCDRDLDLAVGSRCGSISVESRDDLARILEAGKRTGQAPRVSLRVNPRELNGPFALKMGGKPTQFGVDEEDAPEVLALIAREAAAGRAFYAGIHIYAGTQCLDASALAENVKNSLRIAAELEEASGMRAPKINLGGGFGVPYYEGQEELDLKSAGEGIARAVSEFRSGRDETSFVIELGRFLVSPPGRYLSRVLAVKESRGKTYAILDGGMHQHNSASGNLGQTIKRNYPLRNLTNPRGAEKTVELAGCLCTPIDLLGFGACLPETRVGDLICVENSGAYGYTASPLFFLGHETPREIGWERGASRVIRESLTLSGLAEEK